MIDVRSIVDMMEKNRSKKFIINGKWKCQLKHINAGPCFSQWEKQDNSPAVESIVDVDLTYVDSDDLFDGLLSVQKDDKLFHKMDMYLYSKPHTSKSWTKMIPVLCVSDESGFYYGQ